MKSPASSLRWLPLGAALMASACAVGPDFKRPDVPQNAGYTAQPLPQATAAAPVTGGAAQSFADGADVPAQWWTVFQSDKLDALVQQALRANADLAAAQAALRQAHEQMLAQEGGFYPAFTGNASAARQKISGASFGEPGTNFLYTLYNATVNVSYTLDVWGGVRRGVEAQAAQAEYEKFELEASYLSLTSNVVTAAIQEASLRAQLAASQDIVDQDRKELDVVNQQFTLGGVARADVLAQQTELAQALATLPPLRKQFEQNRDLLAVLIGQTPNEQPDARFELADLTLPESLPVSLPAKLVEQRPDVRAQEALLHEACAKVGVATANMLPTISITGDLGGESTKISDLLKPGSGVWTIGAGAAAPLFEGGMLYHQRGAAKAAFDQATAQYRATVLGAFQNVADALHALDADADALQAQNQAAQAASASLDLAKVQYQAGAISYLGLLNAERSYQQSRVALAQAQAARYADTAALFQALGGGWWNRTEVASAAP